MKALLPVIITDSILLSSSIDEDDYAEYNDATTYSQSDRVILLSTHKIYESLSDGNTSNNPPNSLIGSSAKWKEIGATNRWAMLDGLCGSQSSDANIIEISLDSSNTFALSLLNMDCVSVEITVVENIGSTTVLDETIQLLSTSNIIDFWTYCFEPFVYRRNLFLNFPLYSDSTLNINFINNGGTAKCGELFFGNSKFLGKTIHGLGLGINSFSIKTVDEYGNYTITKRPASKRENFDLIIFNEQLEHIVDILSDYESVPIVWIATDNEPLSSPLMVYGIYRDFNIVIPYDQVSFCSLEIDGIISKRT